MPIYSHDHDISLHSSIGRGPAGHSVSVSVVEGDPSDTYRLQFKDAVTDEVFATTPNMDPGARIHSYNDTALNISQGTYIAAVSAIDATGDIRIGDYVLYKGIDSDGINYLCIGMVSAVTSTTVTFSEHFKVSGSIGDIANGSITTEKLADSLITTAKLAAGSVTMIKLASDSVSTAKIIDGAVTTNKLADDSVATIKLADDSVTADKLADDSVTADKLADGAVTYEKLSDDATVEVTGNIRWFQNLNSSSSSTIERRWFSITQGGQGGITASCAPVDPDTGLIPASNIPELGTNGIQDGSITTSKIADGAVTDAKLMQTGGVLSEVAGIEEDLDNIAYNNVILDLENRTFVTPLATWQSYTLNVEVPEDTSQITTVLGNVTTDSGTLPTNLIGVVSKSGSTVLSTQYIKPNVINSSVVTNLPDGTDNIDFRFYTNNATALNTSVTISSMVVFTGTELAYALQDTLYVKSRTVAEVDSLLDELDGMDVDESKNILTSSFKQADINSSGVYSTTEAIHTTATQSIEVKPNTSYTLSWKWNNFLLSLYLFEYDEDETFIQYTTINSFASRVRYSTFQTGSTTKYIRLKFYSNTNTEYSQIVPESPQLELGGLATPQMGSLDVSHSVDYEKARNSSLVVPDYYFEDGYLTGKISTIRNLMFDAHGNYDAFIFITDTHWNINQQKSPALIRYIKKALNINRIFHGGDMYDYWSEYYHDEVLKELESAFDKPAYCMVGNHEYKGSYMDDAQLWYFLNSMHDDIVPGDVSRNYYYVDNQVQKIRYVVLNTYRSSGSDAESYFDTAQASWFSNVALNVSAGWSIVVLAHAVYDIAITTRARMSISGVTDTICDIVDNYSGNGEIACVIQGHTHIDRITSTPNGTPIVITTCDKNGIWTSPDGYDDIYESRPSGTIAEQAFDIVVLDKTNRLISFVRIGSKALNGVDDNIGSQVEIRQVTY